MADGDARWPSWRRVAFVVPVGAGYVGAGQQGARTLLRSEAWDWPGMLLSAGTWAIAMVLFAVAQRAGWFLSRDEAEGRAMVRRAVTTGHLPPGARPEAWRAWVRQEVRELRQARWVVGLLALLVVALVGAASVATRDAVVGLLAAALAGFTVVPVRWFSRRAQRAGELLPRLEAG